MKNKMNEIDDLIRESLSQEEAEFYNQLDEQNPVEMLGGLFRGKNRWFMILINIVMLGAFVAFIYCLVRFVNAETTEYLIKWGAGGFTGLLVLSMLKLFAWMQMDKNALMREIKRLELQISSLAGKRS
jgi:hypothetical protein